jgi:hypothetical protein
LKEEREINRYEYNRKKNIKYIIGNVKRFIIWYHFFFQNDLFYLFFDKKATYILEQSILKLCINFIFT